METTTDVCSVALGDAECMLEDTRVVPRLHNELILQLVEGCLRASPWSLEDVSCVAFSAGPGSFTGVRIAAAVAQGVGLAHDLSVCAVPTSAVMAHEVVVHDPALAEFTTVRRSRQQWVYAATHARGETGPRTIAFDRLVDEAEVESGAAVDDTRVALSARHVLRLAWAHPELWDSPETALPIYVDGDTPWKPNTP